MSAPAHVINAETVTFSYGGPPAVRDFTLDVRAGEFVALAGPNGAGKSTLLHLLTGYLKPQSGRIVLNGTDLARLSRRAIARSIAFVAQKTQPVFSFRVLEMVLMGRQPFAGFAAFDTPEDFAIAREALAEAGISHLANKEFDELSGGEQQLVIVARALAQRAAILILDEPVAFLDVRHQWEVMTLLARLRDAGRTIIATFHDLNLAARWCSRLVLMRGGARVSDGPPAEVLAPTRLREVYGAELAVEKTPGGRVRVDFPG